MNIVCVYVFPTAGGKHYDDACRFVVTYNQHAAGHDHRLIIVSNGGKPTLEMRGLVDQLDHSFEFFESDNRAWDISAFQDAAMCFPCDMMVFFGTSAYLRGAGWLKRFAEAFAKHGNGALYGATANCGCDHYHVLPHIRTTGFFVSPALMNMYPTRISNPGQRYPFEHGATCFTQWCRSAGRKALMVTWSGEFEWPYWDKVPNGFQRGDQRDVICGDRLTAPPYYHTP